MAVEEGQRQGVDATSERRSGQLRRLAAAALLLNSTVDIDKLRSIVAAEAGKAIGVREALVALVDEERVWDDELLARVCRENRPHAGAGRLAAPLGGRDGRALGAIALAGKDDGDFTDDDKAFLVELAQLASSSIEHAQLYEDLARRADELDAVYRLTDAVARAESLDEVFGAALEALQSAVGVERASVVLFEADGSIHFAAWRGLSDTYRERVQGKAPWKGRSGDPAPFVVDDVFADPEVADLYEAFREEGIHSMMLVPLVHAGVVLGRFVLYGDRPGVFPPHDLQLAETMATHVAAAAHRRRSEAAVRESRNQLEAIFRSVADGITAQAPDGSIVYANEAAAHFSGYDSLEEFLATPVTEVVARFEILDEDDEPLPLEQLPGRVALVEGRESERLVQYRFRDTGERRWSIVRATPVLDEEGRAVLAINVFRDLTTQRRASGRLRVLADAGRTLSSSLAVDETLAELARLVIPSVADYCLVDLLADDGSLREVTHVHVDPEGERTLDELRRRYPVLGNPAHPVARVVATREPHFQAERPEEELDDIALDDDHRALYRRLGPTSFMAVPLVARGRTLGAISLGTSAASGRRLDPDDLSLALELAERAALAVDNALLYQEAQAEVAERQRTEERLRALGRASEVLAGSLDYEETLRRVAGLVVPSFADWCIVYEQRPDGTIRRLAIEHSGGRADQVREVLDRFPLDPAAEHGVPAVLRTGVAELDEDESAERLTRDVSDPNGLMAELGDISPRSSIRVPLIARGRTLGAIALLAAESGRSYGPEDLAFASELARRSAVAVDNALLFREATESFARLDTFLGAAQVGLAFVDTSLRFVQVNEWLATVNGMPIEAHLGRTPSEVSPELGAVEPLFREVLESRRPIIGLETGSVDGRFWTASYYPVREPDGQVLGVGAIVRDVTDDKREQIRADLRTRSGEALAASLDPERTLADVAALAVTEFADACSVFLVDEQGLVLRRVAGEAADPERAALFGEFPEGFQLGPDSPLPSVQVLQDGEPLLVRSVTDELVDRFVAGGIDRDAFDRFGTRSFIIVPLRSRARTLGVISFSSTRENRFDSADLATAVEVARRAGVAVDNARLYAGATESLALLDALFATAPAGLAFFDTDLRFVRVNESLAEITGVAADDHVGRTVGETAPAMDPTVERDLRRVLDTGEPLRSEVTGLTPSQPGEERTWIVDYYPVVTPEGRTLGIGAVVLEITERKRAEAQLRESEARFRRLADTIPALVWMSDTNGDCTYFNRRWLEFTGRTMDEELGVGWYESVHPDDVARVRAADEESLRNREPFSLEYRLARRDGVYRWVLDECLPRFTAEGEFAGHIGACIDIDDRKRAESRQAFLAEASTGLAASLEVDQTLDTLARLAVPQIADWSSIVLREDDGGLRTVAVAHADPAKTHWADELQAGFATEPDAPRGAPAVIRTGEPELESDLSDELLADLLADRPELLEPARELGLRSWLVVPLVARGRPIGALRLVTTRESGRRLGEDDIAFAQEIARRAAVAVDNAQLFAQTEFQRALLERQGEASIDGLLVVGADSSILSINQRFREIWQIPDEAIARGDDAALEAALERVQDPEAFIARVRELYERRETSREDLEFRDGRTIERYGSPVTGQDGAYLGYLWSFRDITERRRAAERLEYLARTSDVLAASLDLRETLTQVASLAIPELADFCVFDAVEAGEIVQLAAAHRSSERSTFQGDMARHVAPLDHPTHPVSKALRTRKVQLATSIDDDWLASVVVDADHHRFLRSLDITSFLAVPLLVKGHPIGCVTLGFSDSGRTHTPQDVSLARELAQRAALAIENARLYTEAEARARSAQALEFVGDGVFLVDAAGRVALWNPAATTITGVAEADVVGRPAAEALPGWPLERLGQRTETHPVEIRGRELWLSFTAVAFPHGTVFAFRDLTEEYALERLKTDFVSTVSHELRTPLAAIYGAAMTLQRTDVVLADDQRSSLLNVVAGESERLARIVNDVLWASRLDSGVLNVAIESCDAGALATAVVAAARAHLPAAIDLTLDVAADTPPVAADPDKVRQVLVNLVDNAIKYSPDGGLVEVRVTPSEHTVRFSVSDRGLGIPAGEHGRIFEKFFRLDPNLTRGVGGTGLGLYICRELARRMDGRIGVESVEGAGSTFWFELPVAGQPS